MLEDRHGGRCTCLGCLCGGRTATTSPASPSQHRPPPAVIRSRTSVHVQVHAESIPTILRAGSPEFSYGPRPTPATPQQVWKLPRVFDIDCMSLSTRWRPSPCSISHHRSLTSLWLSPSPSQERCRREAQRRECAGLRGAGGGLARAAASGLARGDAPTTSSMSESFVSAAVLPNERNRDTTVHYCNRHYCALL